MFCRRPEFNNITLGRLGASTKDYKSNMEAACRQCDRILAGTGRGLLWNVGGYGNVFMNSQSVERKDYYLFYHIAGRCELQLSSFCKRIVVKHVFLLNQERDVASW